MDFIIEDGVLKKYTGTELDIVLPEGIKKIDNYCFQDSNITSAVLPNGLEAIGEGAFVRCKKLKSINIPSTVNYMYSKVFAECISLQSIKLSRIDSIGNATFYGCSSLKYIVIPKGVEFVGTNAFFGCNNLKVIVLPDNHLLVGPNAFTRSGYIDNKFATFVIGRKVGNIEYAMDDPFFNRKMVYLDSVEQLPKEILVKFKEVYPES